jgi:hypothetical protein
VEENDDGDDADDEDDELDDDDDDDEPVVVFEVASAVQPVRTAVVSSQVVQAKGSIVTIPKRIPPPLPLRNPARSSQAKSDLGDVSGLMSPARSSFASDERLSVASEPTIAIIAQEKPKVETLQVMPAVEFKHLAPRDIPTPVSLDSEDNASFKSLANTQSTNVADSAEEHGSKAQQTIVDIASAATHAAPAATVVTIA